MNGWTGGTRMSSTGIDRVVKKTLRLSLSLGAVVAQRLRAQSTRCHELLFGEYCDRGVQATGCQGFGRVATSWMARSVHLGCYIASHNAARKAPLLRRLFRRLLTVVPPIPIHHTNRRPLVSCQCIPLYCLP